MGDERATSAIEGAKEEVRELLREIDSLAELRGGRWAEKRTKGRRKHQAELEIRYLAPDGTSVFTVPGTTRDISLGGLGFVSTNHFMRKTPLLATISLSPDKTRHLPGTVVYSRRIGEGWYLTGVKFGPVDDPRLSPDASQTSGTKTASSPSSAGRPVLNGTGQEPKAPAGARERALGMLAAAGAARHMSNELITRVVTMSMSSDHVVRRAAIPVLMQVPGQNGVLAIIDRLDDPNPTVQGEAADALGKLRATQAVDDLRRLLRHGNPEVSLRAAVALGRIGDGSGLRVVARVLQEEGPLGRRAARALGLIVGQPFRANAAGVTAARNYVKTHKIK